MVRCRRLQPIFEESAAPPASVIHAGPDCQTLAHRAFTHLGGKHVPCLAQDAASYSGAGGRLTPERASGERLKADNRRAASYSEAQQGGRSILREAQVALGRYNGCAFAW